MRVFAISDIHVDFEENRRWVNKLSQSDYKDDILILAGDVTDIIPSLIEVFEFLKSRFWEVLYIPGNHDLWVFRNNEKNSLEKFHLIKTIAGDRGINMEPAQFGSLSIVPLFGWYDYSFGQSSDELVNTWADFTACKWPDDFSEGRITNHFVSKNEPFLNIKNRFVISFSHFLPRIDLMPFYIPPSKRTLYPVLGTSLLERQIRKLRPQVHIYGHSHVNLNVRKNNIIYINNALGYPYENIITAKKLLCVFEF